MAHENSPASKRAFGQFTGKFFANFAPSAASRKGKPNEEADGRLDPVLEAHLCQLAMMENYASHGMYVKFTDDEARALEDRSVQMAIEDSKHEEEAKRTGRWRKGSNRASSISSQCYSPSEVQRIIQLLKEEGDLFSDVTSNSSSSRSYQGGSNPTTGRAHNREVMAAADSSVAPPKRFSSFSKLRKKLLPSKSKAQESSTSPEGLNGQAQRPVSNPSPPSDVSPPPPDQAADEDDQALMERALEQSRKQAELDEALRDARALRLDLGHEQRRCEAKRNGLAAQQCDLEARCKRLSGKQKTPLHLSQQLAETQHLLRDADERVEALKEAVEELSFLEDYVRSVKPSKQDAVGLAEVIVRQLLGRLNILGFGFHVPATQQEDSSEINRLVSKFRSMNPGRTPPASPPMLQQGSKPLFKPEPRAASQASTAAPYDYNPIMDTPPQVTGSQVSPRSSALSEADAPSTPVKRPQQHATARQETPQNTPPAPLARRHMDARTAERVRSGSLADLPPLKDPSSSKKANSRLQVRHHRKDSSDILATHSSGISLTNSQGSKSTVSTSRQPSQDLGPGKLPAAKRSSQVVHLYAEFRRMFPEVMQVNYASQTSQRLLPRTASSQSSGDNSKKEGGEESEGRKGVARIHARLVTEIGAAVSQAKFSDMEDLQRFVSDCSIKLASIGSEQDAVLRQFSNFPKVKWTALKEAAEMSSELQEFSNRMATWKFDDFEQGTFQEEIMVVEVFLDTAKSRMTELQAQYTASEKKWAALGIPWTATAFKACRLSSLHVATLVMSRALISVANLERSQTLKADACIELLAAAVRIAYKVHQFCGGFNTDATELFEKVKRLAQYYVRSRDPTWLKDTTKFTH